MVAIALAALQAILGVGRILWGNPWGRALIFSGAAFAFGFYKGYAFEHHQITALKARHVIEVKAAIDGRDDEWKAQLAEANQLHETELAKAIEASNATPSVSTRPELERLCGDPAAGADCRSAKGHRMPSVQKPNLGRD